jgi:hypothetical protein
MGVGAGERLGQVADVLLGAMEPLGTAVEMGCSTIIPRWKQSVALMKAISAGSSVLRYPPRKAIMRPRAWAQIDNPVQRSQ